MKKVLCCATVAFAVALAVVVGNRMSAEAMAVVIGVVCGVAASVPMTGLVLLLSRRGRVRPVDEPAQRTAPPVFVLAPTPASPPPASWAAPTAACPTLATPAPREYRVIGDESF